MHYVVSIPLDPGLASYIGKKGSENSITFYNRTVDDNVIVGLAPTSIEERFYAVAESMLIANSIVVSTASTDKLFGEMLVACSLMDKPVIFTDDNSIDQYLKSVKIKNYEIVKKEDIIEKILAHKPKHGSGSTRIDIDKAFPVKGVGTVALGIVTDGTVKVHDELFSSSGKKATVRSIQAQDQDFHEAGPGTRVGLALKGIEADELEKGDLLTKNKIEELNKIAGKITVTNVNKEELKVGVGYDFISNFSYAKAVVEETAGEKISLKLAANVSVMKGDEFLLMREKAPRIFAHGVIA